MCMQDVVLRGGKALPLYGRLLEAPHLPPVIVLQAQGPAGSSRQPLPQPRAGDTLWTEFLATAAAASGKQARPLPHIVDAAAPSTILFSSGTTVRLQLLRRMTGGGTAAHGNVTRTVLGSMCVAAVCAVNSTVQFKDPHTVAVHTPVVLQGEPKAIPWTHTTPLRCAVDGWSLQDIRPGDVVCWPTNLGWMMGPWLVYASLLNGASIALYQVWHHRSLCCFV